MLEHQLQQLEWPAWYCPDHDSPIDSNMRCERGAHVIATQKGIPRFTSSGYAEHFGAQWNQYRLTQLDSYTGFPITRTRLDRCLGEIRVAGKFVLECGCGAGRFTEILLDKGAFVTSVDLSSAVDANAESFPVSNVHRIAQADIRKLPFAPQQFDVVICLGVVQHTPSPEQTIARLYDQVRPGGWLVIDHYAPPPPSWHYGRTAPLLRLAMRRMSPRHTIRITRWLTDALLPIHKGVADKRFLHSIVCRISPLITLYDQYPQLPDKLLHEWTMLDTHDVLTDWFKHFRTVDQIRQLFVDLGGTDIWCEYGGNGVEARCRRPGCSGA